MEEIINVPDNIPQELLEKADCVIVIPSVKKLAIGFSGMAVKSQQETLCWARKS